MTESDDRTREILNKVASGELTPEEAERELSSSPKPPGPPEPPAQQAEPKRSQSAPPTGRVKRVEVRSDFGAVIIEGDSSVAEAEVEGEHTASIEGHVLSIRGERWKDLDDEPAVGAFAFHVGGRRSHSRRRARTISSRSLGRDFKLSDIFSAAGSHLRVRVNPDMEVDVRIDAGPVQVIDVRGPIKARAAAGPLTVEGFEGPIDLGVNAGAIRAVGRLTFGESKISSDAGAVRVELDEDSSVHVTGDAALGKVAIDCDTSEAATKFGSHSETTIGDGDGTLRIETAMGSIHVSKKR